MTRFLTTALFLISVGPAAAVVAVPTVIIDETGIEHGGGCRKNSPPGQCCHAGSQPYHCH